MGSEVTSVISPQPPLPALSTSTPGSSVSTNVTSPPAPGPASTGDGGPIPMSFPSILRGQGISDRFAHLRPSPASAAASSIPVSTKRNRRDEKEGKRWVRRKENARFTGNAHIVAATKQDYIVPMPSVRPTFPQPLPGYLHRTNPVPAMRSALPSPLSANAGRFSLSLKGMRRELRRSGPRNETLIREVENAVLSWLDKGVWLDPDVLSADMNGSRNLALDLKNSTPLGTLGAICEVQRTHGQLVWIVGAGGHDDAFTRYVVHCCARYHNIVSFSKDISGTRFTYLLRPSHPIPIAMNAIPSLDTPPPTDLESSIDPESDFAFSDRDSHISSDVEAESDIEATPPPSSTLPDIVESESRVASPLPGAEESEHEAWSVLSDVDADVEGEGLAHSVRSLSLSASENIDLEATPRASVRYRQVSMQSPLRSRLWERQLQRRSASSPSRSPARRGAHPAVARVSMYPGPRVEPPKEAVGGRKSFYEYLFS